VSKVRGTAERLRLGIRSFILRPQLTSDNKMRQIMSRFIVTFWIPALLCAWVAALISGPKKFWLLALPILVVFAFMTTLASIHNRGKNLCVKRFWGSREVAASDVLEVRTSMLEGIGVVKLNRFAAPWGRIYFVKKWSDY
jgi:uncharacterized membrane protein